MMEWEVAEEDVALVLESHGIFVNDEELSDIHSSLNTDSIVDNLMCYTDFDEQTSSMLEDIEIELMEDGIIPTTNEKKYTK